jgi:CheY-like chemotaxis protein
MNRLISEAMKDEKYSVDSCFDGREALDYALAVDYDVIILDVNLPKMDGFAVVEKLRAEGCISPVLFLTESSNLLAIHLHMPNAVPRGSSPTKERIGTITGKYTITLQEGK